MRSHGGTTRGSWGTGKVTVVVVVVVVKIKEEKEEEEYEYSTPPVNTESMEEG